jgi:hypothetical protein
MRDRLQAWCFGRHVDRPPEVVAQSLIVAFWEHESLHSCPDAVPLQDD